ncbi:MAG: ATP-binding protein [Alphaproteobacteria bacterium]|nr:ATP-binding protein [Alphaproteobacteria bacterium]
MNREHFLQEIAELFETFPVVAILGARQCGKSTLAQQYARHLSGQFTTFDLENEMDQARLIEAQLTLQSLSGLIIIDEIQRRPNLFPVLRYLVDTSSQKYLILGSASRDLIQQSSESLAGRIAYIELPPFLLFEVGKETINNLWWRGGFPRSFLASSEKGSYRWRQEYIKTFLERDLALSGFDVEPATLRRFWQMLAHYHGQTFNAAEIAASLGFTAKTSKRYIDILEGTYMVRQLKPWFENISKRQVKASKVYMKDSGLLHTLLGITDFSQLQAHPKVGASWEGFAIENIINSLEVDRDDCYFWATHNHAELDLMVIKDGKKLGFEFKYTASPKVTKSMGIALDNLNLSEITVIVPQGPTYPLGDKIRVCSLGEYKVNEEQYMKIGNRIPFFHGEN